MKNIMYKSCLFVIASGVFLTSCKDNEKTEPDYYTASDNAYAQGAFDDMAKVSEDAVTKNNGGARMAAPTPGTSISCATVTIELLAVDSTKFIINFPAGGSCNDGKVRTGTITAVLDGASYNSPGATLTLTTSDYTVNGHKIEGKKVITCVSGGAKPVHRIVVSDLAGTGYAKITYADGISATWKSSRTRTLEVGGGDTDITNNKYDISSTVGVAHVAEGVNRSGVAYTIDIVSPIRVDFSCFQANTARYPTQGELKISPDGKDPLTINYGDGTCDNKVVATFKGKTYTVNLTY